MDAKSESGEFKKQILMLLGSGLASEAQLLQEIGAEKNSKSSRRLNAMKRDGLIAATESGSVKITKKGTTKLWQLSAPEIDQSKAWDGRWHAIVVTMPTGQRSQRDRLRRQIKALGLAELYPGMWVHKYSLNDLYDWIKNGIDNVDVAYMEISSIDARHAMRLARQFDSE